MSPKKTRKPFTLFQRETRAGPVWYVRFWDGNAKWFSENKKFICAGPETPLDTDEYNS
jgi:hypothetical protein